MCGGGQGGRSLGEKGAGGVQEAGVEGVGVEGAGVEGGGSRGGGSRGAGSRGVGSGILKVVGSGNILCNICQSKKHKEAEGNKYRIGTGI